MLYLKRMVVVLFAVALLLVASITTASAATQTIELETRSALLIDKSGSANKIEIVDSSYDENIVNKYDLVVYFDHRISTDSNFAGGGNSSICEVIDELADAGFVHITVITDGEQWPADYSSLGVYTDLDLTIYLVEETKASEEFIEQLKNRLVNSNLKVVKPHGSEEVVLDEYQPPIYEIEIEVPVIPEVSESEPEPAESSEESELESEPEPDDGDSDTIVCHTHGGCPHPWLCWLAMILALLALLLAILALLRKRGKEDTTTTATPAMSEDTIAAVATKLGEGDVEYYVDNSTSFEGVFYGAAEAARRSGTKTATTFGSKVKERDVSELPGLTAQGQTRGWEALETTEGGKKGVMLTDGYFNGKMFDENAFNGKHFSKFTMFAPAGYNASIVENLKKIADEVEVLPLQ